MMSEAEGETEVAWKQGSGRQWEWERARVHSERRKIESSN